MSNEYAEFDTAAASAEIASELFAPKEAPTIGDNSPVDPTDIEAHRPVEPAETKPEPEVIKPEPAEAAPADPSAPAVIPGQNSVPADLPKSWKKDMAPVWEKMAPDAKAYIREREAQVMRGINQYQQGYTAWENVTKPFSHLLERHPDVNPVLLMHGLMKTHLHLLDPSVAPGAKQEVAQELLRNYGITLGAQPTPAEPGQIDPQFLARLDRAERLVQNIQSSEQARQQVARQEDYNQHLSKVDAFSADPTNKYFGEVGHDMLSYIKSGQATDVKTAYELACWTNPVVREKMLAEQQSATKTPPDNRPRGKDGKFLNLDDSGVQKTVRVKPGTIDNTIDSIVAKHYDTKH